MAQCIRPYYLCEHCHCGQFPVNVELDIENTELSPGVRRMLAAVGQEAPFEQGREQMELLAGLSVSTKAGERTAEAIGEDIEVRQQRERQRALQLELGMAMGARIPVLYLERMARAFRWCGRRVQTVPANRTANRPTTARPN